MFDKIYKSLFDYCQICLYCDTTAVKKLTHKYSIFSAFSFILCVLFLSTYSEAVNYPCPLPPQTPNAHAISLKEAFTTYNTYPVEWYYVTGSLDTYLGPLGFEIIEFIFNTTLGNITVVNTAAIVTVALNDIYITVPSIGLAPIKSNTNPFNLEFKSFDEKVRINYRSVLGVPGEIGSSFIFSASAPNLTIELLLVSSSPAMFQGLGGYVRTLEYSNECNSMYYVSMPQLRTVGSFVIDEQLYLASGLSWFDHEWGISMTSIPGVGWYWMGLHINSVSVMITAEIHNGTTQYSNSIASVQWPSGFQTTGSVLQISTLTNWTSPRTNITYPVGLRVITTLSEITEIIIQPIFDNQETGLPPGYIWEGDIIVQVIRGSLLNYKEHSVKGSGYLELTGFTA